MYFICMSMVVNKFSYIHEFAHIEFQFSIINTTCVGRRSAWKFFILSFQVWLSIRRALLLLRKKRFIESQLEKTDGQLENIERMIHDLEFAQIEIKVSMRLMLLFCGRIHSMHSVWIFIEIFHKHFICSCMRQVTNYVCHFRFL